MMPVRAGLSPVRTLDARRRAERTRRIRAREKHPAFREPFEVRRLVKLRVPVERRVRPAEIVGQDEDDVGLVSAASIAAGRIPASTSRTARRCLVIIKFRALISA